MNTTVSFLKKKIKTKINLKNYINKYPLSSLSSFNFFNSFRFIYYKLTQIKAKSYTYKLQNQKKGWFKRINY